MKKSTLERKDNYQEFRNEDDSWNKRKISKHLEVLMGWDGEHTTRFIQDIEAGKNPYDWVMNQKPINPDPKAHENFTHPIASDAYYKRRCGME